MKEKKEKKVLFSIELDEGNKYRRDYVIKKISKYLDIKECSILEIGIGNGRYGVLLGNYVKTYSGIDIDEEYVKIAKSNIPKNTKTNITYIVGNAEKIPFEDKFDIIFYPLSFHFIKNLDNALNESKRLLKSNGIIIIIEPSVHTTNWACPKLREDSPDFDKKRYDNKLKNIERAKQYIFSQDIFKLIEQEYDPKTTSNFYLLKLK